MSAKHIASKAVGKKGMAEHFKCILFMGLACTSLSLTSNAQTLYSSDFSGLTVGASVVGQDGWSLFSGNPSYATVQSDAGNNYLQLVGVTGGDGVRIIQEMPANAISSTEGVQFSLAFRTSSLSGVPFVVNMLGNSGSGYITQMYVDANGTGIHVTADAGNFAFNETASFSSGLAAGVWYIADVAIQPTDGTVNYSFYESVGNAPSQRGTKILDASFALANTSLTFNSVYSIDFAHDAFASPVWDVDNIQVAVVPEPSVFGLLGLGVMAAFAMALSKKGRASKCA